MKTNNQHSIDFAFVLLLFCLLTMCSLAIVYIGSQVYSATVKTMEDHYSMTTANDYILEKTRQNLAKDQIEVRTIDDIDVLCLHETNDQSLYTTYIYVYQGQLRELLIPDHIAFAKENGADMVVNPSKENLIDRYIKWVNYELKEVGEGNKIDYEKSSQFLRRSLRASAAGRRQSH